MPSAAKILYLEKCEGFKEKLGGFHAGRNELCVDSDRYPTLPNYPRGSNLTLHEIGPLGFDGQSSPARSVARCLPGFKPNQIKSLQHLRKPQAMVLMLQDGEAPKGYIYIYPQPRKSLQHVLWNHTPHCKRSATTPNPA